MHKETLRRDLTYLKDLQHQWITLKLMRGNAYALDYLLSYNTLS
jgi:hypothetical protein